VADLIATAPDLDPVATSGLRLTLGAWVPIWSIAPFRGQTAAISDALAQAHGLPFPAPGALHDAGGTRIAWSGLDQAFLIGAAPDAGLARHAALTDQSDAWAQMILDGPSVRDVLARLVPIDLTHAACPPGSARRTLLGHMTALIIHPGGDRFEVFVFRSMTATAVHEVTGRMKAVAARAAL